MLEALRDDVNTEIPEVFEEQLLVLEGLTRASNRQDQTELLRQRLIYVQNNSPVVDMNGILDFLNLTPHFAPHIEPRTRAGRNGATRERAMLKKMYPNYPHQPYSTSYVHELFRTLPNLIKINKPDDSRERIDDHIRKLGMWIGGLSAKEIALEEDLTVEYIPRWEAHFCDKFGKRVTFYELTQATDYVERAMASCSVGHWTGS